MAIDRKFLEANHADLVAAFRDEGRTEGVEQGRQEGAAAERARIQSVFAQAMPGHAKLVHTLAFDGKTTGPEAAAQILSAERAKLGKRAEDIAADAAELAGKGVANAAADPGTRDQAAAAKEPQADQRPLDERLKTQWDADPKLRAEFADNYAAYAAYEKAQAAGNVRILGKQRAA